jgi:hypothetical protein
MRRRVLEGWSSAQARGADGAIESDERISVTVTLVPPTDEGARRLGERYWDEVRRASFGFVRLRASAEGNVLRLLGVPLLRFGAMELAHGSSGVRCSFPIDGGMLARQPGGALSLSQTGGPEPELRAAIEGFMPRLSARPYDWIQRRIHVGISRRFFLSLLAEGSA